ncbi:hypothetical protein CKA32_001285 [Geitlerinema sp. FC II]|nr:hypothetical protein CKA32_001285 [Geitlerinema sp. FC II]
MTDRSVSRSTLSESRTLRGKSKKFPEKVDTLQQLCKYR